MRYASTVLRLARAAAAVLAPAVLVPALAACTNEPFREVNADVAPAAHVEDGASSSPVAHVLHVSVAGMESPRSTYAAYASLFAEVGRRLGMNVVFVQRRTYAEVNGLLTTGGVDVALICTGGYLRLAHDDPGIVEVVAVPIVDGSPTYRSLVVVPAGSTATSIADLAGVRFAFTDALSLTGREWVVHRLLEMGHTPEEFFGDILLTGSHDRSTMAVARGVVDGAAVHSIVYRRLVARDPQLASRIRVIETSPEFGMPPVVAAKRLPAAVRERLRGVLTTLADDPDGASMLRGAQIDRFSTPAPDLYESAERVVAGLR